MLARCMTSCGALHFASRTENRVVFRVALGRRNTGVLNVPVWHRSTLVKVVGFELGCLKHFRRLLPP